jgi:hypothetical protein
VLILLGCPPPAVTNVDGVEIPRVSANNGITQLVFNSNLYYSEYPDNNSHWYDINGVHQSQRFGKRLSDYWRKIESTQPTKKGKKVVEQFNIVTPEEEDEHN